MYQQWAIYEMQVSDGSFDEAERLAGVAAQLNPHNRAIAHTRAEVARRRAQDERSPVRRERYRQQARQRLGDAGSNTDKLVIGTRCKLLVDEVTDLVKGLGDHSDAAQEAELAEKVREAEATIRRSQQLYPDEPDVLQTEASLRFTLDQGEKALAALERAWKVAPKGSAVALRLARAYINRRETEKASQVLREALERNPDDRMVHFELGRMALETNAPASKAMHHLERSYSRGDANFEARHLHAQLLFMTGCGPAAMKLFAEVDHAAPPTFRAGSAIRATPVSRQLSRYRGRIVRKEATYALVSTASYPAHLHVPQRHSNENHWRVFGSGSDVDFSIGFARRGPVALDATPVAQR